MLSYLKASASFLVRKFVTEIVIGSLFDSYAELNCIGLFERFIV